MKDLSKIELKKRIGDEKKNRGRFEFLIVSTLA